MLYSHSQFTLPLNFYVYDGLACNIKNRGISNGITIWFKKKKPNVFPCFMHAARVHTPYIIYNIFHFI